MKKRNKHGKLTYGIVGIGRFGYSLAMELAASGAEILVIDREEEIIREMREVTDHAFIVKSLDKATLMDTGIQDCDIAVVCIGEQVDTSILTTLNLISMGVPHVISKANSAEHGEVLEKLGAEVVYPERDMAVRVARRLENIEMMDFIQLSERINISKLHIPEQFVGKSVVDTGLRKKFNLNIVAIENKGKVTEIIKPDYILDSEDILFLCGSNDGFAKLSEWLER